MKLVLTKKELTNLKNLKGIGGTLPAFVKTTEREDEVVFEIPENIVVELIKIGKDLLICFGGAITPVIMYIESSVKPKLKSIMASKE